MTGWQCTLLCLVYRLYDLTEDEIALIENETETKTKSGEK